MRGSSPRMTTERWVIRSRTQLTQPVGELREQLAQPGVRGIAGVAAVPHHDDVPGRQLDRCGVGFETAECGEALGSAAGDRGDEIGGAQNPRHRDEVGDDHRDAPFDAELGQRRLDRAGDGAERRDQEMRVGEQRLERELLARRMAIAHQEYGGLDEQELGLEPRSWRQADTDDHVEGVGVEQARRMAPLDVADLQREMRSEAMDALGCRQREADD